MKQTRLSINTVRLIIYTLGSRKSSHGLIASRAEMADNLKTLLEFSISLSLPTWEQGTTMNVRNKIKSLKGLSQQHGTFSFILVDSQLASLDVKRKEKKKKMNSWPKTNCDL